MECGVVTWGACGRPCAQFVDSYGVAVFLEVGNLCRCQRLIGIQKTVVMSTLACNGISIAANFS